MAVLEHDPKAKLGIGPATDEGFYYDFEFSDDSLDINSLLPKIEKKMRKLAQQNITFDQRDVTLDEIKEKYGNEQPYKLELAEEYAGDGKQLTLVQSGDFEDLCKGGHVDSTKEIDPNAFTLDRVAGAYWRGDENNTMLTRIYGLAFESKEDLDGYLQQREEAAQRDHRKLGKELDLFAFSDLIGAGLPVFTPRGTFIRNQVHDHLLSVSKKYGMQPVTIPHIAKRELYETSGHAAKFGDELIKVISHYDEFVMKPVNCPHHTQIYASRPRSYRDLPIRYMESTMQYRDEKPGEISGLTRVRAITVDDGHIFCTVDHIKQEAKNIAHIIEEFYSAIGLWGKHWVSLSVRDQNDLDAYIGENTDWEKAESMLQDISDELQLGAQRIEGEAAIYGPKLDYMFEDSLGREWQLATIQIDFAMPKRFELEYTADDGTKKHPVMIHRAILGSYERFLAILIEHFAGKFPLWLSPVQVKLLTVSDTHAEYAHTLEQTLVNSNIRVEVDDSDEKLGKKIRNAKTERVPYYIVIGDNEVSDQKVTLEGRDDVKHEGLTEDALIEHLQKEIDTRA